MAKRYQFRHVNELTGFFVLIILIGAVTALFLAARSQNWFTSSVSFRLQLPPSGADGLKPGNSVVILGLPAGLVKNVRVQKNGDLEADLAVRIDFAQFVRLDSQATIKKVYGIAGDSYVELSRGTTGEPLPDGSLLACRPSEDSALVDRIYNDVKAQINPLLEKSTRLLDNWSLLGTRLQESELEFRKALTQVNGMLANLESGRGTVGRLLTDSNLVAQSEQLLTQSQETLEELREVLNQVKKATVGLPEVTENLRLGTARLPGISVVVDAGVRDLPGVILQVQQTAYELQRLTEAVERHWLIRKYVEPRSGSGRIPPSQLPGGGR